MFGRREGMTITWAIGQFPRPVPLVIPLRQFVLALGDAHGPRVTVEENDAVDRKGDRHNGAAVNADAGAGVKGRSGKFVNVSGHFALLSSDREVIVPQLARFVNGGMAEIVPPEGNFLSNAIMKV